jgi:hypothetical protein
MLNHTGRGLPAESGDEEKNRCDRVRRDRVEQPRGPLHACCLCVSASASIQNEQATSDDDGKRHQFAAERSIGLTRNREQDRDEQHRDEQRKRLRRAVPEFRRPCDDVDPDGDSDKQETGQSGRSRPGHRGECGPFRQTTLASHRGETYARSPFGGRVRIVSPCVSNIACRSFPEAGRFARGCCAAAALAKNCFRCANAEGVVEPDGSSSGDGRHRPER